MQNRYSGDIGDFSKLGLLRALLPCGIPIGINWYLVPDETHNGDGRHVKYLEKEGRTGENTQEMAQESIEPSGRC